MIEKAILITKIANLKYVAPKYRRLYFGNEFCQRLLPARNELEKVLTYCHKNKLEFSLVTPYVTEEGLKDIEELFVFLKDHKLNSEVIINDWGVLDLLNEGYPNLQPVLGRLLTKQNRDPRITRLIDYKPKPPRFIKKDDKYTIILAKKPPETLIEYYKESNVNVLAIQDFLLKQRIKRVDLDNLFQGVNLKISKDNLSASLYIPYGYITTTRLCSASPYQGRKRFHCMISSCKKECQRYILRLINPEMPKIIYKKGNTLFFKNSKVPAQRCLERMRIDRLVYQPEIPV